MTLLLRHYKQSIPLQTYQAMLYVTANVWQIKMGA